MGLQTAIALTLLSLSVAAAEAQSSPAPAIQEAFERASAVITDVDLPGQLLLTDATGEVKTAAFGLADRERRVANTIEQPWLWASISKQVTATLVMQAVDQGKLALDHPIGAYLPTFGGDKSITIQELLQHRSGLPNPTDTLETNGVPAFYRETGPGITDAARAAGFCSGKAKRQRGERWEYNNCDYLVLAAILEAVSGTTYAQLLRDKIATPLELGSLRVAADGAFLGGAAAVGYSEGKPLTSRFNVATGGAAAALLGTARDLAAFDRALMNGSLLSTRALTASWTGDPQQGYQALGVWAYPAQLKGCAAAVRLIERRGDYAGTQVRNIIAPDLGRAVILFTNDADVQFGEVWQGKGLTYDLLAAALCTSVPVSEAQAAHQ